MSSPKPNRYTCGREREATVAFVLPRKHWREMRVEELQVPIGAMEMGWKGYSRAVWDPWLWLEEGVR